MDATYRVMIEGGPLYLADAETNEVKRLGFFTTRWIAAQSEAEARNAAWQLVLEELAAYGNRDPCEEPISLTGAEVARLSPLEAQLCEHPGHGFTFYPQHSE